ncbi:MAG: hypothetical protein AAF570_28950, partial [Bacteroidota bacterium]
MRKSVLLFCTLFFVTAAGLLNGNQVFGQSFSVRVGTGYSMPLFTGDVIGTSITVMDTTTRETVNYGTFGGGVPLFLDLTYMFSETFGVHLGMEYLNGIGSTTSSLSTETTGRLETYFGRQLRLLPSVVIKGGGEGLRPFVRFGPTLPLTTTTFVETDFREFQGTDSARTTLSRGKIAGKSRLGFHAVLGLQYPLNDKVSLAAELSAVAQRIRATSGELVLYEVDGQNMLADQDRMLREWNY